MGFDLWSLLQGASSWASRAFSGGGATTTDGGTRLEGGVSGGAGAGGGQAALNPAGVLGGMVGGFGAPMDWKGAGFGAQAQGKITGDEGGYASGHLGGGAGAGYATWEDKLTGSKGTSAAIGGVAPVGVGLGNEDIQASLDTNVYRGAGGSVYSYDKDGASGYGGTGNYVPFGLADTKGKINTDYGSLAAGVDNAYAGKLSADVKVGEKDGTYFGDATVANRTGFDGGSTNLDTPLGNAYAKAGHLSQGTTLTGGGSYDSKTGAADVHGGGYTGVYGKDLGYGWGSPDGGVYSKTGAEAVKYGYEGTGKLGWDPTKEQVYADASGRGGGVQVQNATQQGGIKDVGSYNASLGEFSNDVLIDKAHAEFGRDSSKVSVGTVDGGGVRFKDAKIAGELGNGAVTADAHAGSVGSTNSISDAYLQANYKSLEDASLQAGFKNLSWGGWSGSDIGANVKGPAGIEAGAKLGSFNQGLVMQDAMATLDKNGLNATMKDLQYDTLNLKDIDLNAKIGDYAALQGSLGEFGTNHVHGTDMKAGLNWDQGLYAGAKDARYDAVFLDKLKYDANLGGDLMKSHLELGQGSFNSFSGKNIAANIDSSGAHAKLEDGKYRYLGGKDIGIEQSYLGGAFGYGAGAKEASLGGVDIGKLAYDTNLMNSKLAVENLGAHGWKSKDIDLHQNIGALGYGGKAKELNALDLNIGKLDANTRNFGLGGNVDLQKANLDLLNVKGGDIGLSWGGKQQLGAAGDFRSGFGADAAKGNWDILAGKADGSFKNANYGAQLGNASLNLFGNKLSLPDAGFKLNASGGGNVDVTRGAASGNLSLAGSSVNFAGHELTMPEWAQAAAGVDLSRGAANVNLGGENGVGADLDISKGNLDLNLFGHTIDVDEGIRDAVGAVSDVASDIGSGISSIGSSIGDTVSDLIPSGW